MWKLLNTQSDPYFCLNSIKTENQTLPTKKLSKKEEPLNLNYAEPSEVKSLTFPVNLC